MVSWGFIHACKPQITTTDNSVQYKERNQNTVQYSLLLLSFNVIRTCKFFAVSKGIEMKKVIMFLYFFRELKRLESVSRSPVYSHVSESVGGTVVVRAYSHQRRFTDVFLHRLDSNLSAFILLQAGNRWLGICLVSLTFSQLCIFKFISSSSRLMEEYSSVKCV